MWWLTMGRRLDGGVARREIVVGNAVERALAGMLVAMRPVSAQDAAAVVEGRLHRPAADPVCGDVVFPRYGLDGSRL